MTTTARTPADPPRLTPATPPQQTPAWMTWAPRAALAWAVAYGAVRLWFATGHTPTWKLPTDLLIPAWVSVAACALSAAAALALTRQRPNRVIIGLTWALAALWVAACGFILLDFVGGILPGLGIPFDLAGLLSRLGGLTGATLLAATALARQRQINPDCLHCIGHKPPPPTTPRWATTAAWIAVFGCVARLLAQAAVGFDQTPYAANPSMLLFEIGFVCAGIALPLLLVYRLGRVFPRWMLLLPGAGLGTGITAYFGVGLVQTIAAAVQGQPVDEGTDLPDSFFWVAIPAYVIWGVGLALATYGYYLRTRKSCKYCGR